MSASHFATQHFAARGFVGARSFGGARAPVAHWSGPAAGGFRGRAFGPGVGGHGFWRGSWHGGYWGGRFWPGVYYRPNFAWFLPVLPLYCTAYWWGGVPYYYYNDIYYAWSPTADGYVASEPPPAADGNAPASDDGNGPAGAAADSSAAQGGAEPPDGAEPPTGAEPPSSAAPPSGGDNVYAYPANGQSEAQQATDRMQCDQWAASQSGAGNGSPDFRRAVIACFQGRGYSAQ
ncbi:MAG TPA: hypothetical protein VIX87_06700 [Steroidobacteraceae bacterium]